MHLFILLVSLSATKVFCFSRTPVQYHIQTDRGPDRYFRYQTYDGQYRREKRFEDGRVIGTYGWVDPTGLLRLYDYIADDQGYRIVRQRTIPVEKGFLAASKEHSKKKTINHFSKPKLRPLPAKSKRKSSSVSSQKRKRQKYKSARQRLRDQQGKIVVPTTTNPPPFIPKRVKKPFRRTTSTPYTRQRVRTRVSKKPSPVKVVHHNRKQHIPARRRNQIRTKASVPKRDATKQQASSFNPTFLTNNVPPDLGYDAPGGRVTIDFDLGIQYRREKIFPGGVVVGEHGYVDPLGILRKTYYRSDSEGQKEFKRSYWVGTRSPGS